MPRQKQMLGYLHVTWRYRPTPLSQLPAQANMLKARRETRHRRGTAEANVTTLHLRRAAEGAAETSEAAATTESGTARQLRRAAVGDAETMQQQPLAATGGTALGPRRAIESAGAESGTARQLRRAAVGDAETMQQQPPATPATTGGTARHLRRAAVGDAETRQHQPRRLATSAATGGGGAALTMLHDALRQPRRSRTATRRSRTTTDGQLQSQLQRQQQRECGSNKTLRAPDRRRRFCYRHRRPWGRLRCRRRSRCHRRRSEMLLARLPPQPPQKGAESMERGWWRHSPPRNSRGVAAKWVRL
jgi:hypothetical protein